MVLDSSRSESEKTGNLSTDITIYLEGVDIMFSRKPQTALTAKKNAQRNHSNEKKVVAYVPSLQPVNGFANVNGIIMPF